MDSRVERYLSNLMIDRCGDVRLNWRWEHEKVLLNMIRNGRPDLIAKELEGQQAAYHQTMDDVNLSARSEQEDLFHFISAVTLFSRAAIEGGLPETLSYSMMESYMYCASKYRCDLFLDALYSYAGAVADYNKKETSGGNAQISRIKSYVMDNLNNPIDISSIGKLMHLSTSRCSHLFKEKTGMTIHQYVELERIKAACAYLAYTDKTISGLSEYLVFSSPAHFASVFKKHTGLTPKEWRRRQRNGDPVRSPGRNRSVKPD